jgi:hypothetical protein
MLASFAPVFATFAQPMAAIAIATNAAVLKVFFIMILKI